MKAQSSGKIALEMMFKEYRWITILVLTVSSLLMILSPFIPVVAVLILYAYVFSKAHRRFMENFAKENNLTYASKADIGSVTGRLFSKGHSKHISNIVSGLYKEHPFRLFNYRYTVGSGKNSHTYKFTVYEIVFEKTKFPHILLHSKTMWSRYGSIDMWGSDKDIRVSLEEPFNEYFNLYVTQDYEIEALQIFTSSVLDFLKNEAHKFSIEFADNRVYIYDNLLIHTKSELDQMYSVARKIFDAVGGISDRLYDDFEVLYSVYKAEK